jgi:HTH-type transcriptional regulator/antitoxin HigA
MMSAAEMTLLTIENDDDLTAALTEIRRLWNAEPGTEDGDRLDALVAVTTAYEDRHYPVAEVSEG